MIPENEREFNYRYGNTYLSLKNGNALRPVKLIEATSLENFVLSAEGGINERVSFDDINFDYPELGYIDINDNAWYVSRAVSREYKRGLIPQKLTFSLAMVGTTRRVRTPRNDSWGTLKAIYNPKFTPFDEAVELITSGTRASVPVSKEMAIGISGSIDAPIIFYENVIAGWVEDGIAKIAEPMDFVSYDLVVNGIESEVVNAINK